MIDNTSNRPNLAEGWYYPDIAEAESLHAELQRELPPGHLLFGVPVTTFAARNGTDDTLFRHHGEPERFTMIHLTWLGKTEINSEHPTVEFDGTFAEFIANEERRYGLRPQSL
jgi:hypothetical protein